MSWNIFARYYSEKENHWTESLVKFLANSSNGSNGDSNRFRKPLSGRVVNLVEH